MTREEIAKAALEYANEEINAAPYDAFMAGAKWADSHPHWISVEEELPPRWETNPNVSVQVITCKYVDSELQDIDLQRYHFGDDRWLYGDATHWMPFQFPEEGGEK